MRQVEDHAKAGGRLLAALLANAPRMNFLRFCELIELAAPDHPPLGSTNRLADDPVRFRSAAQLGFPGREMAAVEQDAGGLGDVPTVRTTFIGLYGVDAFMPSYFVDEIAQRRDGAEPLAAFLDLFHHRMVTQFYRVASKYRYPVGFRRGGRDKTSQCLLSLVGLGIGEPDVRRIVETPKLLSMLGLAGQRTRTAEGLAGVLRHAVPDACIKVEEFHPVWVRVDDPRDQDVQRAQPLGDHCVLGRGFVDRTNTVRVVLVPQTGEAVLGLLPGGAMHRAVLALLGFYLGYAVQACLEMHVLPALMPAPRLNAGDVRLGYSMQLQPVKDTQRAATAAGRLTRVQLGTWTGHRPTHHGMRPLQAIS